MRYYEIQRFSPDKATADDGWMLAYKMRGGETYIQAGSDAEAIDAFHTKTGKSRTPMRLILRSNWGLSTGVTVVATNGIKPVAVTEIAANTGYDPTHEIKAKVSVSL